MAEAKNSNVSEASRSQAERLLELAKARQTAGSGHSFLKTMGKNTLRKKGRKTAKGGVGGGAEGA